MKNKKILNLDINSTQPIENKTLKLIIKTIKLEGSSYLDNFLGNRIKKILKISKNKIAKKFKTKKKNIIFTSSATEGIKKLIKIICKKKKIILSSPFEHSSINNELIKKKKKIKLFFLKNKENKNLSVKKKILKKTNFIFISLTSHETGIILNINKLIKKKKKKTLIISDFSNSIKYINVVNKNINIINLSSTKLGAISGISVLIFKKKTKKIKKKFKKKKGTQPFILIKAFAEALINIKKTKEKKKKIYMFKKKIEKIIKKEKKNIKIINNKKKRINNLISLCIKYNIELIKLIINIKKICIGYGSACNYLKLKPNINLISYKIDNKYCKNFIRISFYEKDNKKNIIKTIKKIKKLINIFFYHPSFLIILFLISNSFNI